jgi:hypothetical protein
MKIANLLLCLCLIAILPGCKKDDADPNSGFDINNPDGYALFWKVKAPGQGSNPYFIMGLLELKADNTADYTDVEVHNSISYMIDGNKIVSSVGTFTIEDNAVSAVSGIGNGSAVVEAQLIKLPATSAINGNLYSGKYYRSDGTVLHNYFFYSFTSATALAAGTTPGTASRTGTCLPVADIGAYASIVTGTGDSEFLVLVNGILEVNYRSEAQVTIYSGELSKE